MSIKSCSGIIFKNSRKLFNAAQCCLSVLKNKSVDDASAPNALEALNSFLCQMSEQEYLNPQVGIEQLQTQ